MNRSLRHAHRVTWLLLTPVLFALVALGIAMVLRRAENLNP
jgi:hypothetical protein